MHLFDIVDVNVFFFYKFSQKSKLDMIDLRQNYILPFQIISNRGFSRYVTRYTLCQEVTAPFPLKRM
jgi:hypothetical protein